MDYGFADREAARDYFTRLAGLFKNLNYAPMDSMEYATIAEKIDALAAAAPRSKTTPIIS